MKMLQLLVQSCDSAGPSLVAFYRQLLPMFNLFHIQNVNCGDHIDYGHNKCMNLGDLVDETLQVFERYGGQDAFINIKYMVPTYESYFSN